MTSVHYFAITIGAVSGGLIVWLLVRMVQGSVDHINQPFETNGEADLAPSAKESFADVKGLFRILQTQGNRVLFHGLRRPKPMPSVPAGICLLDGDDPVGAASAASQDVVLVCAVGRAQRRSNFITNPATGALEVRPDAGLVVEKALRRALRPIQFGVYRQLFGLYVVKLRLELSSAAIRAARNVLGALNKCRDYIHGGETH